MLEDMCGDDKIERLVPEGKILDKAKNCRAICA